MSFLRDRGRLADRLNSGNSAEILQELQDELRDRDMFFEPNQDFGFSPRMQRPSFHEMFNSTPKPFNRMGPGYENLHPFGGNRSGRVNRHPRERNSSGSSGFSEEDDSGRASGETSSQGSGGAEYAGVERTIPIQIIHERPERDKPPPTVIRSDLSGPQHSVSASQVESRIPKVEDESRQTRASSAPPEGRPDPNNPGKFVSKVKIANDETGSASPYSGHPQPNVQQSNSPRPQRTSQVRNIPIIIEGRDDVDNARRCTPQSSPRFPTRISRDASPNPSYQVRPDPRSYSPRPPSDDGFRRCHSPNLQREAHGIPASPRMRQNESFQRSESPKPQEVYAMPAPQRMQQTDTPQRCQSPRPTGENLSRPHTPQPPHQEEKPEAPKVDTATAKLEQIHNEVDELQKSVECFSGPKGSKDFLYLDEMLTRTLLKLDDIETGGRDEIRQRRKAIVSIINSCIELLEKKGSSYVEGKNREKEELQKDNDTSHGNTTEKAPSPPPREKRMKSELTINLGEPADTA